MMTNLVDLDTLFLSILMRDLISGICNAPRSVIRSLISFFSDNFDSP